MWKPALLIVVLLTSLASSPSRAEPWGVETYKIFDNLKPEDVGLTVWTKSWRNLGGTWTQNLFSTSCPQYVGCGTFNLSAGTLEQSQAYPWIRVLSWERRNYGNPPCQTGETDLGGGWCRVSKNPATTPFQFLPDLASFTAYPCDQLVCDQKIIPGGSDPYSTLSDIDNVIVEVIRTNISVDFKPGNSANGITPQTPGWTVYIGIKTTSTGAGDTYNFNAANVDPASLRVGPARARALTTQSSDIDGDGDTDYVFGFRTGDIGLTCVDTSITIAGRTYAGDPIAGRDVIVPINCYDPMAIDVDPFNTINVIRPNDNYNVTVAILGMRKSQGDPIDLYPEYTPPNTVVNGVDTASLRFGPAATPVVGVPVKVDIDGDANTDLLANFNVFDAGIACGDTEVSVTGKKISGYPIRGTATIVTDDCQTGGCHP